MDMTSRRKKAEEESRCQSFSSSERAWGGSARRGVITDTSSHEIHYTVNRAAAEEQRKKTSSGVRLTPTIRPRGYSAIRGPTGQVLNTLIEEEQAPAIVTDMVQNIFAEEQIVSNDNAEVEGDIHFELPTQDTVYNIDSFESNKGNVTADLRGSIHTTHDSAHFKGTHL
ncbi:hypothetical protein KSP40_PGU021569 [Platanthera guangdongensis]|uniref:Uncharacterized protein n=1 Tax=Platanthera guangdongensis TaxID=2320717 RepID=A0ABR2N3D2_9ASPA